MGVESEEEKAEPEPMEQDPPKVELTAEEKTAWFSKADVPDLVPYVANTSFAKYSVPEKEEGFDEIKFDWADVAKSKAYLKIWIMEKKISTRVEDLVPSQWF